LRWLQKRSFSTTILARGAVGLRGDNCDFEFKNFRVTRA
jgi:hypothetical protein